MSESPLSPHRDKSENIEQIASSLDHLVDDSEQLADCRAWILEQFRVGVDADGILAQILENGWPSETAEALVEDARKATRHLRGVVTRDQVAAVAERRYRNSFKMAFGCDQQLARLSTDNGISIMIRLPPGG